MGWPPNMRFFFPQEGWNRNHLVYQYELYVHPLVCSVRPFRSCAEKLIHRPQLSQRCQAPWPLGPSGTDRWCMEVWGETGPRKFGNAARRESGGHGSEMIRDSRERMVKSRAAKEARPETPQKQQVMLNMAIVQAWTRHFAGKPLSRWAS